MAHPVRQRLADIARDEPGAPALVGFDLELAEQTLSWADLGRIVDDTAGTLRALPDRDGPPCVLVEAANTVSAATAIAAVLAAGLPLFPLNPATPPAERDTVMGYLGERFGRLYQLDTDLLPRLVTTGHSAAAGSVTGDVAYLLATGGSTGVPKIALRPGPLAYDPAGTPSPVIRQAGWRTGQRQLIVGPLYHAASFTAFLDALLDRNTVVLQPFFDPTWTVRLIERYAIEWLQLTPTHMREILLVAQPEPASFATVRALLHTAARCDPDTKRGWIELLGPRRVYELYGATEGIGVTLARGDEWLARPGTVGRGFLTQIRILDDAGAPLPPDAVGTVYLRTPRRLERSSYVGDHALATTPDGFATVGDRGRVDRDGFLYLEPRGAPTINVGGEKVDPHEVEAALLAHPDVVDAVALGVPHEALGSVVGVHVVLRPAATVHRGELAAHCGRRLAGYKIPKQIRFVDQLPRSASGKLERRHIGQH